MIKDNFRKISEYLWEIPETFVNGMRVPAKVYANDKIWKEVEEDALKQLVNTTFLPGMTRCAIAMPDIHSGYGPPIGGVGAMTLQDGIISPGFVGFDENCGVRLMKSGLRFEEVRGQIEGLAEEIYRLVPSGLGKGRRTKLSIPELERILNRGVPELVEAGYGDGEDIEHCEERGRMEQADAGCLSEKAKNRGRDQLGTLGSGNHFCEIQRVEEIFDKDAAGAFGLFKEQIVVMIHTGSRGLGHQNCTDYLGVAGRAMAKYGIHLPDRELACMPFGSNEGQSFFKAMSCACNFAWANRQMIAHYVRKAFSKILGEGGGLVLLYDVAHNIAKVEEHRVGGKTEKLIVHRKGATRALPASHRDVPESYKSIGQPVLIPGSMGTASYVCVGKESADESFYSVNHGAGRLMSRKRALKELSGRQILENLKKQGIVVKCHSSRGIAEEAPSVYKNIDDVVEVLEIAGLCKKVAGLRPLAVIKGE